MNTIDGFLVFIGFLFTFFVPGFLVIEFLLPKAEKITKLPLYLLLSVLISTHVVYLVSLILGFSRSTVLFSFSLFLPGLLFLKKGHFGPRLSPKHRLGLGVAFFIFLLFFAALYPAIFFPYRDYFVMSAVNWQDTPMHLGIIQSISQGNFPPQAPYFSGHSLAYYYFTDFHTATLTVLTKSFFPQILVLDNPLFVFTFFLALYSFGFYLTKSRLVAIFAGWLGTFSGSFIFIRFFQDLFSLPNLTLTGLLSLLASRGYTLEYQGFFQIVPAADYFLQNRPLMVGLPSAVLTAFLLYSGFKENQPKKVFLAGLITGLVIKFQLFAYGIGVILFFLSSLVFLRRRKQVGLIIAFLIPVGLCSLALFGFSTNDQSLPTLIKENFIFGPWNKTKDLSWYLRFYPANLGISFILSVITLPVFLLRKDKQGRSFLSFLLLWLGGLFLIPNLARFTVCEGDMLKFFFFMFIPAVIVAAWFLDQLWQTKLTRPLIVLLLFFSSLTGLLTLSWSFLNKRLGYSQDDLQAGLWIRNQTPPRSVFIGLPTVHSPITQIGGRLRVLSYINWPYSHGFNRGEDNVFRRREEIEKLYQGSDEEILKIMNNYQARYVFYGQEEKKKFPEAETLWKTNRILKKIYHQGSIQIYQLVCS